MGNILSCGAQPQAEATAPPKKKKAAASLGIVRLDYDYPPSVGDIDHPDTYDCACTLRFSILYGQPLAPLPCWSCLPLLARIPPHPLRSIADDVFYRVVPGLTFEMCQNGTLTPEVERGFVEAIRWLVSEHHVSAITGDCGFMMYFQKLARRNCELPVFMSALAQLPSITCAYQRHELIAIFTANAKS